MDTAVGLVKAYLELCGYFVLAELPVRAADRQGYHDVTDLDLVAVRFPHPPRSPGHDVAPLDLFLGLDPRLQASEEGVDVLVGEVKEGAARLNPALRRARTVAFALRRVGCCPEPDVEREAWRVVEAGAAEMAMPGRVSCRVRLVAFAGHGTADGRGVLTVPLGHCATFVRARLREAGDVLAGTQFKDPVLALYALEDKLARYGVGDADLRPVAAGTATPARTGTETTGRR
jgi:hypothetical protein